MERLTLIDAIVSLVVSLIAIAIVALSSDSGGAGFD